MNFGGRVRRFYPKCPGRDPLERMFGLDAEESVTRAASISEQG